MTTTTEPKLKLKTQKQLDKQNALTEQIARLRDWAKLDSWNAFVEELHAPPEIALALATGQAELIRLAKPRPLTAEDCAALYKLIAGLLDTNAALREHAAEL